MSKEAKDVDGQMSLFDMMNGASGSQASDKPSGYKMAGSDEILSAIDNLMGTSSAEKADATEEDGLPYEETPPAPDLTTMDVKKFHIPEDDDVVEIIYEEGDLVSPIYASDREFVVLSQKDRMVLVQDPKSKDTHEMALADLKRVHHYGLIFDMDGTLWDSSEAVAASWTEVLSRYPETEGQVITAADVQAVMGQTMTDIQKHFGFTSQIMKECMTYENAYLEEHGAVLYPQLAETLQKLSNLMPLYIVSNCQKGYIEAFLKWSGLEKHFKDHLCFGDNNKGKDRNIKKIAKYHSLTDYFYVGDIENDYNATVAAGGTFIYASYGFGEAPLAKYHIDSIAELPDLMKDILDQE